jgi:hypothetical protein
LIVKELVGMVKLYRVRFDLSRKIVSHTINFIVILYRMRYYSTCTCKIDDLTFGAMKKKELKMLTTKEVAEKLGAAESSVRMWARKGRFPGAEEKESPRGPYWLIPDTALEKFELRRAGRPRKDANAKKGKG